ncbi:hypothetical protein [Methyloversatilis sp.]|uniref:hypothetical protein n=1 Tax=Methyloversatilis sp. TaxID=2569862 RepID=UPI0035B3C06C
MNTLLADEPLFIMDPFGVEIRGTRLQIESEIPIFPGVVWPDAFRLSRWDQDGFSFSLRRCKPPGSIGHKAKFKGCDYWSISWRPFRPAAY